MIFCTLFNFYLVQFILIFLDFVHVIQLLPNSTCIYRYSSRLCIESDMYIILSAFDLNPSICAEIHFILSSPVDAPFCVKLKTWFMVNVFSASQVQKLWVWSDSWNHSWVSSLLRYMLQIFIRRSMALIPTRCLSAFVMISLQLWGFIEFSFPPMNKFFRVPMLAWYSFNCSSIFAVRPYVFSKNFYCFINSPAAFWMMLTQPTIY